VRGAQPLDNSAVHPESYSVVKRIAGDLDCTVAELIGHPERVRGIELERYVDAQRGLPTLRDIAAELEKPGRDPRASFEVVSFDPNITAIEHLQPNMLLPGIVTNVTKFGAFVDVGVHQDGLVHVSELANRFVRDPSEAVKVGDKVKVRVLEVDLPRKRIALSIKRASENVPPAPRAEQAKPQQTKPQQARPQHKPQQPKAPPAPPAPAKQPFNNPFAKLGDLKRS
jgi:protein Tex